MYEVKEEDLVSIASGNHSSVFHIARTKLVLKKPVNGAEPQQDIERRIYDRLGFHPSFLTYRGIAASKSGAIGLLFDYCASHMLSSILDDATWTKGLEGQRERWILELGEALAFVHSMGVIHGDIGSHNILVDEDGPAKLIDFGGSRLDGSKCLSFPSARYRRIPAWEEEAYEPEVKDDIFALGMVLYEIETGKHAYGGLEHDEILSLMEQDKLPGLTEVPRAAMRNIIRKCWEGHYESSNDLCKDIQLGTVECTM
ncbi:kinase-like protein [Zopfia rhizophila CBS 207.26]|uniref:Kinase-like protein n=1 Tax=Zopfia rhizophila CBS 207.26 TaxID=1314779 RepID=A0A6A6EKS1_9PEZI|nr:kinase-like protein [Zopfia rhizophila CBS 207.26]